MTQPAGGDNWASLWDDLGLPPEGEAPVKKAPEPPAPKPAAPAGGNLIREGEAPAELGTAARQEPPPPD